MTKLQWDMKEVFYFPTDVGVPSSARVVKVKAGFTEKRSEDAVRLSGIYHIAAKVEFGEGQRAEMIPQEVVYVDDVEMDGQVGYFEYAVPLNIDLPPEVEHPLRVEASDVNAHFDGQGALTIAWNVNCAHGASNNEAAVENTKAEETASVQASEVVAEVKQDNATAQSVPEETISKAKQAVAELEPQQATAQAEETQQVLITEEKLAVAHVSESHQETTSQQQATAKLVPEVTATYDSSSSNGDDILSYIAELPDGWSTTSFRSNDVFVE
ncbi:hypothetical protein QTL97_14355 [Sporosarcina thermotolerans]|uniref:Uncharacterized protein n=1 Tax=Sporosarcina thermotolerans TaxID=633404 RepID=A0AAW9AAY8_9BACL|nr:hypothetical protein [Sporosarcina thermotolerans]MDW0118115.1 hypothetical protein [Sporosarcina thermotolerans]WHT47609.1 hypothetical protein QNH10_15890 [Sporosarcina thermotolerans]